MGKNVTMKCPQCGRLFVLGKTGARGVGMASKCDDCQGIERADDGTIWMPWEQSIEVVRVGDTLENAFTITSPETHRSMGGRNA